MLSADILFEENKGRKEKRKPSSSHLGKMGAERAAFR